MKKIITIVLSILALVSLQSCESIFGDSYSAKVTTLEATEITHEGYTFNASIEWKGNPAVTGQGGVFYGRTPGISNTNNMLSSKLMDLKDGTNNIHSAENNYFEMFVKNYYFETGETVYYRAFAKVFTAEGETEYIYGEEKSFVIPAE